jgi:hypothetical protein
VSRARDWSAARLAVGALVVAAVVVTVVPQHAAAVTRVLVAAVALLTVAAAIADRVAPFDMDGPGAGATHSVFDTTPRARRPTRDVPSSLSRVRGELVTGSVRADVAPLSPLAARRLADVVDVALAREGLDRDDPAHHAALHARLSPQAWAAVTVRRTGRPPEGERDFPRRNARADEIAATVHAVLDEVEHPRPRRER